MNSRHLIGILTLGALASLGTPLARAQATYTWTQTAGQAQSWSVDGNWLSGTAPSPVAGDIVDFSTVNIAANTTLSLDADRTAEIWRFGDTSGATVWTVSAGATLILAGATPAIEVVGSTNRVAISTVVSAPAGLTKVGAGTVQLTNASSVIGPVTASAGVLDLAGIPLANLGDGNGRNINVLTGAAVAKANPTFNNDFLNRIAVTGQEFGVFMSATGGADNNTNLDFSSAGTNLSRTFLGTFATNGAQHRYNGIITPASDNYRLGYPGHSGALHLMQAHGDVDGTPRGLIIGGGAVVLTNENTFTGDTVIRSGRLFFGRNLALQFSALNVGAGAGIDGVGGTICFLKSSNLGAPNAALTNEPTIGGLMGIRNLASIYNSANQNNTDRLLIADVLGLTLNVAAGKTFDYAGNARLSGSMYLTKTGAGTQVLSGLNDYAGPTTISAGTLSLGTTGSIATSSALTIAAGATLDTSGQATYGIPASQTLTFGIDAAGSGSAGRITAAGLDISTATVTWNIAGTPDDPVYVLATYTPGSLTGAAFLSVPAPPSGYSLNYAYEGNKIALVRNSGGVTFASWQSANGATGGLDADHDGDGVANGIEFFLGGAASTSGATTLHGPLPAGSSFSITWTKAADYPGTYGNGFVVETATSLTGTWTTESAAPGGNVSVSGNQVTYTFPLPLTTPRFVRLRVTGP